MYLVKISIFILSVIESVSWAQTGSDQNSNGALATALYRTAAASYIDKSKSTIDSFDKISNIQDINFMLEEYLTLLSNFDQGLTRTVEEEIDKLTERNLPFRGIEKLKSNLYKFRNAAVMFLRAERPGGLKVECDGASTTTSCIALVVYEAKKAHKELLITQHKISSIYF